VPGPRGGRTPPRPNRCKRPQSGLTNTVAYIERVERGTAALRPRSAVIAHAPLPPTTCRTPVRLGRGRSVPPPHAGPPSVGTGWSRRPTAGRGSADGVRFGVSRSPRFCRAPRKRPAERCPTSRSEPWR
jgi:hypothetical protein